LYFRLFETDSGMYTRTWCHKVETYISKMILFLRMLTFQNLVTHVICYSDLVMINSYILREISHQITHKWKRGRLYSVYQRLLRNTCNELNNRVIRGLLLFTNVINYLCSCICNAFYRSIEINQVLNICNPRQYLIPPQYLLNVIKWLSGYRLNLYCNQIRYASVYIRQT